MIQEQSIGIWTEKLASSDPTPGGGGASAVAGVLAASLGQMVGNLTVGKKRYAEVEEQVQAQLERLMEHRERFFLLARRDEEVFAPLAKAYRMPVSTEEERAEKEQVMERCLLDASLVPLEMMEETVKLLEVLEFLGEKGSRMAVSDVGVAVQMARASLNGAVMNVWINTRSMKNRDRAEELNRRADQLLEMGNQKAEAVYSAVREYLRR